MNIIQKIALGTIYIAEGLLILVIVGSILFVYAGCWAVSPTFGFMAGTLYLIFWIGFGSYILTTMD
jgi:hypothetical protein